MGTDCCTERGILNFSLSLPRLLRSVLINISFLLYRFQQIVFSLKHQPFWIQELRLYPHPQELLKVHGMVFKKSQQSKRRGAQDAKPSGTAGQKIQSDRRSQCQERTNTLPKAQAKKDALFIIHNLFYHFYLHLIPSFYKNRLYLS